MDIVGQPVTIPCSDGYELGATLFEAAEPAGGTALIGAALGVPAGFYRDFATHLAAGGLTTLTWDWRGIGQNRPRTLRGFDASATDWATVDLPAVIDWAHDRYRRPIVGIGHSFGAQAYGLAGRPGRFERLLLVAAPTGYWGMAPAPARYAFRLLLATMPLVTRCVGYMPARRLGLGEDVPRAAALEWFRWCRSPDYIGRWDGHAAIEAPVCSLGFSDDGWAPDASRRWLLDKYGGSDRILETVDPAAQGLPPIGHHGFFRSRRAERLWPAVRAWLLGRAARPVPQG